MADPLVVQPEVVGHHEELVGGGKLDVPPGVGEELGELRFLRVEKDDLVCQLPEEVGSPLSRHVRTSRHDLGQRVELRHGASLGDPFGTERDVDGEPGAGEEILDQSCDPRVDRRSEHDQLTVANVRKNRLEHPGDGGGVRVQVLVDRRPDDNDHRVDLGDHSRVGRRLDPTVRADSAQQCLGAVLEEGHGAVVHQINRCLVDIEEGHGQTAISQGNPQGQPNMAASTDDCCRLHRATSSPGSK